MPDITLTLTDEEMAQLNASARANNLPPKRMAWQIIKRQLAKANQTPRSSPKARSNDRMGRQLALVDHLEQLPPGHELTREQKRELAQRFKVAERTIYRDIELAARVLDQRRSSAPSSLILTR